MKWNFVHMCLFHAWYEYKWYSDEYEPASRRDDDNFRSLSNRQTF